MDENLSAKQETRSAFFRMPKVLLTDERYAALSNDAKLLYGLLLDRMSLSEQNGWTDEQGRIFLYFTVVSACEVLHCAHTKGCALFAALEGAGLIVRRQLGQGRPARIYVKKLLRVESETKKAAEKTPKLTRVKEREAVRKADAKTSANHTSGRPRIRLQDVQNLNTNKTEQNKTERAIL